MNIVGTTTSVGTPLWRAAAMIRGLASMNEAPMSRPPVSSPAPYTR